jgi:hypothetical protein
VRGSDPPGSRLANLYVSLYGQAKTDVCTYFRTDSVSPHTEESDEHCTTDRST